MMHGYLRLRAAGDLLVPFRRLAQHRRERAAAELTKTLGFDSRCDGRPRTCTGDPRRRSLTSPTSPSLRPCPASCTGPLTGRKVLGVGDAWACSRSTRPLTTSTRRCCARFGEMVAARRPGLDAAALFPKVLVAGQDAGTLTAEGAALLDPTGALQPGAPVCPPEGDAGTGMVATNAVARRTGNISAGTSIFAMVVLREAPDRGARGARHRHHACGRPGRDGPLQQRRERARDLGGGLHPVRRRHRRQCGCERRLRRAVRRGARRRGGRRRTAGLQLPRRRADHRHGRGTSARRAHPRQPPHARQLHAHPALRRLRHAEPGYERAARRGRATGLDVRARRHVPDRGSRAAFPGGGHRRAR